MKPALSWTVVVATLLVSSLAAANVRKDGKWPDVEKPIAFDADDLSRADALKKLHDATGLSYALNTHVDGRVQALHLKGIAPSKVLELILSDGDYVVRYQAGDLIVIEREAAPPPPAPAPPAPAAAPIPPVPPVPPVPPTSPEQPAQRGEDRDVEFADLVVEKDEVVHDINLLGGDLDLRGTATGKVLVMKGDALIREGARIFRSLTVLGDARIDDGARVDGSVSVMGELQRGKKSRIGGRVETPGGKTVDIDSDRDKDDAGWGHHRRDVVPPVLGIVGGAVTRTALLFVFGAVLLSLATKRMDLLRGETAARPMRSFALGVLGIVGSAVVLIVLCVTIIGIPFAAVGIMLGMFGVGAAICAVLTVVGEALLRHKTRNPYIHLAVGCLLFLIASKLPWIGVPVQVAVALIGIGTLVSTRIAGLVAKKKKPDLGPYRTAGDAPADA